jgi:hypothetical protein
VSRYAVGGVAFLLALGSGAAHGQSLERWNFTARFQEDHSTNLLHETSNGPGDTFDSLTLRLSRTRITPNSRLRLSGWGTGILFRNFTRLDRLQGGVNAFFSYRPSHRASVSLTQSLADGFDPETLTLGLGGFPQVDVKSAFTKVGSTYLVSPATKMSADFSFDWVRYSASSPFSGSQIIIENPGPLVSPPPTAGDTEIPLPTGLEGSQQLLNLLALEGVQTSSLDVLSSRAGLGATHSFSETTYGSANFAYRWTNIQRAASSVSSGGQVEAYGSLSRRLGTRWRLSGRYSYLANAAQNPRVDTQSVAADLQWNFTPEWSVDGSLGASYFSQAAGPSRFAPIGGLGVSARYPRTQLHARYDRFSYQALGLGANQIVDLVAASCSRRISRRATLAVHGDYRHSTDPSTGTFLYDVQYFGATLSWRATRQVHLGARSGFFKEDLATSTSPVSSIVWNVYAQYGHAWR